MSREACCGDVSPDVPDEGLIELATGPSPCSMSAYPALDIAAGAPFLAFFRPSSGKSGTSTSLLLAFGFFALRLSRGAGGDASVGALRLRVVGLRCVGGDPVSVVEDGDASVFVVSALSLAAEARVTLCDMSK